jgi:hypothetical protein
MVRSDGDHFLLRAHDISSIGVELQIFDQNGKPYPTRVTPDILVGIKDFWKTFVSVEGPPANGGYTTVRTIFGDLKCGSKAAEGWDLMNPSPNHHLSLTAATRVQPFDEPIKDYWSLELIGINDDPTIDEDAEAVKWFEATVSRGADCRYSVGWPWIDKNPDLASNYNMTYKRLSSVLNRLQGTPKLALEYDAIFQEQLALGIIEPAKHTKGFEHFLPHHPVITPKKVRIVYDGSAHAKGSNSLNQCLYRGPVLLPELIGLLMRFRSAKYPILTDVEKAFLQVDLIEGDREVTKFLWVKDPTQPLTAGNLQIFRFRRVPFGIISSPYLLAAVVQKHLDSYGNDAVVCEAKQNSYVDNVLLTAETAAEASQFHSWN